MSLTIKPPSHPYTHDFEGAKKAWSLRVQRMGSLIQGAFAGFWLVRGALSSPFAWRLELAFAGALASMLVIVIGAVATRGRAGRPHGTYARQLERKINIATVIQLVASFVLPALAGMYGHPDLILASVVVSVGPLLMYFWYLLNTPRYGFSGLMMTVGPLLLALFLHRKTLTFVTGLAAGTLALLLDILSFCDVMNSAPPERVVK